MTHNEPGDTIYRDSGRAYGARGHNGQPALHMSLRLFRKDQNMNTPETNDTARLNELADFAWDRARRNADAERGKAIASFFGWLSRRERKSDPAPESIRAMRDRNVAPVMVGVSS